MIKDQSSESATNYMGKIKEEYLPEEVKEVISQDNKESEVKVDKLKTWFGKVKQKPKKIILDEDEDDVNEDSEIVFSELDFEEKKLNEGKYKEDLKDGIKEEEFDKEIVINNISNIIPNIQTEKDNKMLSFFSLEEHREDKSGKFYFQNSDNEIESYEIDELREENTKFKNYLAKLRESQRKWNDFKTTDQEVRKGKFTREETKKIIKAIIRFAFRLNLSFKELMNRILYRQKRGINPIWTDIGAELPNRSIKSINDFCHRLFSPYNNKGLWNEEEIKKLIKLYKELGPRWKLIGDILHRHPENVRDKWKNIYKKKVKTEIEEVEKPWNLSTVLKLVKYVNEIVCEKTSLSNQVIKYGFKFNKMFKNGDLDGDRYLDEGEEMLFLDTRIKLFSQRNFVYDIFKDILNYDSIKNLILQDKFFILIDFSIVSKKFTENNFDFNTEDCRKKFYDLLSYYGLIVEPDVLLEFQFINKVYNMYLEKLEEEEKSENVSFDLEKLKMYFKAYQLDKTALSIRDKISLTRDDIIINWKMSKLYCYLIQNKQLENTEHQTKISIEHFKKEDLVKSELENTSNNVPVLKKKTYIQRSISKDNQSVKLKPLKINLEEIYNKYCRMINKILRNEKEKSR